MGFPGGLASPRSCASAFCWKSQEAVRVLPASRGAATWAEPGGEWCPRAPALHGEVEIQPGSFLQGSRAGDPGALARKSLWLWTWKRKVMQRAAGSPASSSRSRVRAVTLPCQDLWSCARGACGGSRGFGGNAAYRDRSWWDVLLCVCTDDG